MIWRDLRTLATHRDLLLMWAWRDLKVRYKQSLLGVAWAVLQPLSAVLILTLIFSVFVRIPTDDIPYPLFSYAALLPWTFFANAVTTASNSMINNPGLISKIYFPREIMPLAAILSALVDYAIAALVFVGMMLVYRAQVGPSLFLLPVLLLVQVTFTLGVALLASAANVFYRDIKFILPLALQLWMYATPVIYPLSTVPSSLRPFYLLNPLAALIDAYRRITIQAQWPDWPYLTIALAVSGLTLVMAYVVFKRLEGDFADVI